MAGIYSALGELDRMRKMAGRRVKDLVTDPLGVLTQQADDLRNTQRGLDPVINAAGAGMAAYGLQDDHEGIFSRLRQYLRQRGME